MKNSKWRIKEYLKKVFSDLHNVLIGIAVAAIVGGGSVYILFHSLWIWLKSIALSPTPLWATIILVLAVSGYMYSKSQLNPQITPVKPKFDFVPDGDIKWKATLFDKGGFRIEDAPLCVEHDVPLLSFNMGYLCQYAEKENCKTILIAQDYEYRKKCVESRAELQFRK